jgi:hypothetical protein
MVRTAAKRWLKRPGDTATKPDGPPPLAFTGLDPDDSLGQSQRRDRPRPRAWLLPVPRGATLSAPDSRRQNPPSALSVPLRDLSRRGTNRPPGVEHPDRQQDGQDRETMALETHHEQMASMVTTSRSVR